MNAPERSLLSDVQANQDHRALVIPPASNRNRSTFALDVRVNGRG